MEGQLLLQIVKKKLGRRRQSPMGASYGKLMMWFFIVSDALTFSGF
jgi:heme/copper-type cytochrome/quinol oxidase subunit 3